MAPKSRRHFCSIFFSPETKLKFIIDSRCAPTYDARARFYMTHVVHGEENGAIIIISFIFIHTKKVIVSLRFETIAQFDWNRAKCERVSIAGDNILGLNVYYVHKNDPQKNWDILSCRRLIGINDNKINHNLMCNEWWQPASEKTIPPATQSIVIRVTDFCGIDSICSFFLFFGYRRSLSE